MAILFSYFPIFVSFDIALSGLAHGTNDFIDCIYAARSTTCRLTLVLSPHHSVPFLSVFASFCPTFDATVSEECG